MARTNIIITETREIEIPDGFTCSGKHICIALTESEPGSKILICSYFNRVVRWSDRAGYYRKCDDCVNATMRYFEGKDKL